MRYPTRIELILFTAICGVVNVPWAILPDHYWNGAALGFCAGSCAAQIGLAIWSSRRTKPSSPSQQLTSGTSQNPSPSASPATGGSLSLSLFPGQSLTESERTSQLPFEKRAVPVVGFRAWTIQSKHRVGIGPGWRLRSFNPGYGIWEPGVNRAECHAIHYASIYSPRSYHAAPAAECTCGFYVLTDFDKVPFETVTRVQHDPRGPITEEPVTMMVGAVVGWGRVVQHGDEGWRAEKVQLIALLDCKVNDEHLRITHEVAESYGVPVVGRKALELLAKEYGERLPALAVRQ